MPPTPLNSFLRRCIHGCPRAAVAGYFIAAAYLRAFDIFH